MTKKLEMNFHCGMNSKSGTIRSNSHTFNFKSKGLSYRMILENGEEIYSKIISKNFLFQFLGFCRAEMSCNDQSKVKFLSRYQIAINEQTFMVDWNISNTCCNIKNLDICVNFDKSNPVLTAPQNCQISDGTLAIILLFLNHTQREHDSP